MGLRQTVIDSKGWCKLQKPPCPQKDGLLSALCIFGGLSSASTDAAPDIAPAADKTFEFSRETTEIPKAAGYP